MSGSSDPEGLPRNLHLHKGFLRQVFHESSLEKEPFELLAGKRSRKISRDFPGSPAVDWTLSFHCWRHEFDAWLGELRFHMLCGVAKKVLNLKKWKMSPSGELRVGGGSSGPCSSFILHLGFPKLQYLVLPRIELQRHTLKFSASAL